MKVQVQEQHPKVVVVRESKDWTLLNDLDDVVAVVAYDCHADGEEACGLPVFHPDDLSEAFEYAEGRYGFFVGEEDAW
ncbi:P-loop NTPase family protein [Paenibacillus alkalitolerans]|uniref:hypothetical protein n=1 Tax=Paenibacillus alkalitolerans TaxID=2799335 RepID=UPI0018F4D406|nr:hypothetical protein [Paenibacillus alkalitolerans]